MRKIAWWNRYSELNPLLFTEPNAPIGDDLLLPFNALAVAALARGVECVAFRGEEDPEWWAGVAGLVFIDRPARGRFASPMTGGPYPPTPPCPVYLLAFENETILPENWENLGGFAKVFSWTKAPGLEPERFVRLFPAQNFPTSMETLFPNRGSRSLAIRQFCTMVASNKANPDPRSLYPKRREVIEVFALDAGFDLYGAGWHLPGAWGWRGTIFPGKKRETMAMYKFALAFENASLPGYITEKLLDCLIAGTVPVYWGAPDIADFVDPDAFLDARLFDGPVEILRRLRTMPDAEWHSRRDAGLAWMNSPAAEPFTIRYFTKTILDTILGAVC